MELAKILLLSLGHLASDINSGALPALLPYLSEAHGFDYRTCGILTFAFSMVSSFIQPVFGLISDKHPKKIYIPIGIVLCGGGLAAVGCLSNFWPILLALFVCGTGASIFHPEGARYANLVSADRKGFGISIFAVGGNAGYALGPIAVAVCVGGFTIGDTCIGGFGLKGTLFFALFSMATATFIFLCSHRWDHPSAMTEKTAAKTAVNDWHAFVWLSLCIISRSIVFLGFSSFLPLYYTRVFHVHPSIAGTMLTLFCFIGVLSNLFGGNFSDKIGHVKAVRLFLTAAIPFVFLFPLQTDPILATALLVPIALCSYAPFSPMVLLGQNYLAKSMGFASGITLGVAISIGGMFSPLIGWIADNYGGLPIAMEILTAAAVMGALASMRLKETKTA